MDQILSSSKNWVQKFVIKHNLCPFAAKVVNEGNVNYKLIEGDDTEPWLQTIYDAMLSLQEGKGSTTILVFNEQLQSFDSYLDFFYLAELFLEKMQLESIFQLASFHPLYQFEGYSQGDPRNKTNQSPYPMIHILRTADVEKAVESFGDTSLIHEHNEKLMRKLES